MKQEEYYPITSLCKGDLKGLFEDKGKLTKALKKKIDNLTDEDMKHIATKMADAYCNCCYWESLQHAFEREIE